MRARLLIVTSIAAILCSIQAEETDDSIDIAKLLQDDDLLDALIMGDESAEGADILLEDDSTISPPLKLESDQPISSVWDFETTVTVGAGYKENVLFSAFDPQDSAFTLTEVEASLFRLAPPKDWQFFGYFLAENAHYLDVDGLDDEWLAIALLQTHKTFGDWKFTLGGQYTFLEQAFSLSFEDLDLGSTKIVLHQFGLKPTLEYKFLERAYLRLDLPIETNLFGDDRQDYDKFGTQVALGHRFENGGKVEASYSFKLRDYKERSIRDEEGISIANTSLEWDEHQWNLALDYYFTPDKTWRSKTLLKLRRITDNGSGYDDFWMYRAQQKFVYARPTWEISASAAYTHYDYDTQTVETGNTNHRHRSRFSIGCDVEKTLAEDWALSLAYRFEDYLSNVPDDVYNGSVISMGLGYTF